MLASSNLEEKIPLDAQKSMYFLEKIYRGTDINHYALAGRIVGDLKVPLFRQALQILAARHKTLQYRVLESEGQIYFAPLPPNAATSSSWPLRILDCSATEAPAIENLQETLKAFGEEGLITKGFNLTNEPLWRPVLLKFSNQHYILLLVFSHLIADATSKDNVLREVSEIYNSLLDEREAKLDNPPALAQALPQQPVDGPKLEYWKNKLAGLPSLDFRTDFTQQGTFDFRGDRLYFNIDQAATDQLTALAAAAKTSVHQIFLTCLYILLYRQTGQNDLCLGVFSANRRGHAVNVDDAIYSFVNTIPLRIQQINGNLSFYELLQLVSTAAIEAYQNQLPIDVIAQHAIDRKEKRTNSTALPFTIAFNLNKRAAALALKDLQTSRVMELNLKHSKFPHFGLNLNELPEGGYEGFFEFNTALFKMDSIRLLLARLKNIVATISAHPHEKISRMDLLTPEEKAMLTEVNNTEQPPPHDSVVSLFNNIAQRRSRQPAVKYHQTTAENTQLTYGELHAQAETLAALLRTNGVRPDRRVGVAVDRSKFVLTFWAVLKSQGVLLPLEHSYSEALADKLTECQPTVVITDNSTPEIEAACKARELTVINIENWKWIQKQAKELGTWSNRQPLTSNNLAYICYTSGTTGKPKGVPTTHGAFFLAAQGLVARGLPPGGNSLCIAPEVWDCINFEILEALVCEGCVHLTSKAASRSPAFLEELIIQQQINMVTLLPQISDLLNFERLPSLVDIIIMGDIPNEKTVKRLMALAAQLEAQGKRLVVRREWGTTECAIYSTSNPSTIEAPHTSIGKPIPGTQIFILDPDGNETGIGIPGRMLIAGPVSPGYINAPELNAKRFVTKTYRRAAYRFESDVPMESKEEQTEESLQGKASAKKHAREPESLQPSYSSPLKRQRQNDHPETKNSSSLSRHQKRLFVTDDLAARLPSGDIDFIGRIDGNKHVKIHGVRVNLDSLANVFVANERHPNIKATYISFDPVKKLLKGFFIPKDPNQALAPLKEINYSLQQAYPHVPKLRAAFIIPDFPLTLNGKIDGHALENAAADPESKLVIGRTMPVEIPPQTDLQRQLKLLWEDVLGLPILSTQDSFGDLGGDSLDLARLEIALNKHGALPNLQSQVNLAELDYQMTIESLADRLTPKLTPPLSLSLSTGPGFFATFVENASKLAPSRSPTNTTHSSSTHSSSSSTTPMETHPPLPNPFP